MGSAPQGGGEAAGTGKARKSRSRRERLPLRGVPHGRFSGGYKKL